MQRRYAAYYIHQIRQAVGFQKLRRHLLSEAGDLVQVLGQNARLVIMEGIDMNGSISLIRLNIVDFTAVHTLSPLYCIGDTMAACVVIADHTAGHTKLLRTNDLIIVGNDTGTGRHIYPVGNAAKLIENQRIEQGK